MTLDINVDKEGFLKQLSDWTPAVAHQIAQNEGIALTDEHWEIISLLRDFYTTYEISPAMRILVKTAKEALGSDKGNSIHLLKLFPGSPAKLASKIAGLPKPTNCL
ncbi:TusE/DsrC/DsvC family sulfur relay protein [Alkalimarinus alittae]|uniref:Sulfurtransferase n=1 Tax=Alkalimarinus alittae TaxID=2961619 RepID=A0ABY6N6Y2_9ALTE|nr:TusE/DsrC/DsvC family sulfur relay protein [Alkalimarinus alittae]UZE97895.1 TusE/DsrC/DsvC family sulfur relay protein [Alkalimarinus alittae]